ncbi:DUF882 domain-containing protein [Venatoribacter cucullus]|uniref:DUF882 domain-containing protein n=1 Tax=Venatoribacter cucullus TaxID=2661630 RepID=UPI002240D0EA|nr:DUF882 domain-containing protein [Venatoribacter cucullus]
MTVYFPVALAYCRLFFTIVQPENLRVMLNRRHFLRQAACLGAAGVAGLSSVPLLAQPQAGMTDQAERTLRVYNIHTGEYLTTTFWADGQYQDEEIQALDLLLRDHRANQAMAMQRELYEKMFHLQELFSSREPLYVISGYRSPGTNSGLRQVSDGVAENSLHMQGRAVDIRIPGVSHRHLHKAALAMGSGGVGYYPKSGYIHLDTGRVRSWTI